MTALSDNKALREGYRRHLAGDRQKAAQIYAEVLTANPENADAWHLSGVLAHQRGRTDDAEQLLRLALKFRPADPSFETNLAAVLLAAGKAEEAETVCRRVLQIEPDRHDAMLHLGTALRQLERYHEGLAVCRKAAKRMPHDPQLLCNLGALFTDTGQLHEALQVLKLAHSLNPRLPQICLNLGSVQRQLGLFEEAAVSLSQATELAPDLAEAATNLANLLLELGQPEQALAEFRRALRLNPNSPSALSGLGQGLQVLGRWNDAMAAFDQACALPLARGRSSARQRILSNRMYCASLVPGLTRSQVCALHSEWGRHLESVTVPVSHPPTDQPDRRLRVGYVSPDFRRHATMKFFLPFFMAHDRENFEFICYSENARTDDVSQQVQELADHWRLTCGVCDAQMVQMILEDQIDILVDLAGHTAGNRLTVFAARPAPIQVSFLGYPNTTGLTRIDYLLTDNVREDSSSAAFFTEQLVAMPHGACCFDAGTSAPDLSEPPVLRNGHVTLGSTHRLEKLSPQCLRLWADVMKLVPSARLLILRDVLGSSEVIRQNLLRQLAEAGIDLDRTDLRWDVPGNHLEVYSEIDIVLDVFPWPSGTTAYEAMWMGVPVPAVYAHSACSGAAASFLRFCGADELIARSPEHYVRLVAALAENTAELSRFRHSLRNQMAATVCNAKQFALDLEQAYSAMWRRRCGLCTPGSQLTLIERTEDVLV